MRIAPVIYGLVPSLVGLILLRNKLGEVSLLLFLPTSIGGIVAAITAQHNKRFKAVALLGLVLSIGVPVVLLIRLYVFDLASDVGYLVHGIVYFMYHGIYISALPCCLSGFITAAMLRSRWSENS